MPLIKALIPREILDGRGIPTIELTMYLDNGLSVTTSVTNSKSKSKAGMVSMVDGDQSRMNGRGVLNAINIINTIIAPKIIGMDPTNQAKIDQTLIKLDGTDNRKKLGSNTMLSISQAAVKAAALAHRLPVYSYLQQKYRLTDRLTIPQIVFGLISGSNYGNHNLDLQEFQVIAASNLNYQKSLEIISTIWQKLEENLKSKGAITTTGIVGGFAPNLYSNIDAFEVLLETIRATDYSLSKDVFLGIDCASNQFHDNNKYKLKNVDKALSAADLVNYYQEIKNDYQIIYIEDPFVDADTQAWSDLTTALGATTRIAADKLLLGGMKSLQDATSKKLCNTVVVKPAHFSTITETITFVHKAMESNMQIVVSHRSGETNDDFLADFAVGVGAQSAKFGPVNRGERVAKYNRLLKIFYELNPNHKIAINPQTTTKKSSGANIKKAAQASVPEAPKVLEPNPKVKLQAPQQIEITPINKNNIQVKDLNMTNTNPQPTAAATPAAPTTPAQPAAVPTPPAAAPAPASTGATITAPSPAAPAQPAAATPAVPTTTSPNEITPLDEGAASPAPAAEAPTSATAAPTAPTPVPTSTDATAATPAATTPAAAPTAVKSNEMQNELNQEINSSLQDLQK